MLSYPFASHADRVVGVRLSLESAGFEATRFKRSKRAAGDPASGGFLSDPKVPETAAKVSGNFSFTLAVPGVNQIGLLAVEAAGWGPIYYVATTSILLGSESAFASNGNETNAASNAPGSEIMANRTVDFDFVLDQGGGYGSTLVWKTTVGAGGTFTFTKDTPGFIIALRLCGATTGFLNLPTAANPWGKAETIGWV